MNVASMAAEVADAAREAFVGEHVHLPKPDSRSLTEAEATAYSGRYQLGGDFYVPNLVLDIVADGVDLYERQSDGRLVGLLRIGEKEFLHRSSWGHITFTPAGLVFYGRFPATRLR